MQSNNGSSRLVISKTHRKPSALRGRLEAARAELTPRASFGCAAYGRLGVLWAVLAYGFNSNLDNGGSLDAMVYSGEQVAAGDSTRLHHAAVI